MMDVDSSAFGFVNDLSNNNNVVFRFFWFWICLYIKMMCLDSSIFGFVSEQ